MDKLISGARGLGLELSRQQAGQFQVYYEELVAWNRRMNLTAITGYDDVQVKHFLDSLAVVLAWRPGQDGSPFLIDVGTGAGLPGLPLKIVFPQVRLVLLEATLKKSLFLKHIVEKLGLRHVEVLARRAEEAAHLEQYREKFDIVVSRAVAPLAALVELALPFNAVGGRFIALKKGDIAAELDRAAGAIRVLGGKLCEVKPVQLPDFDDERYLVVVDKTSPTPGKYPRRPGMPAKRPLE